MLENTLETSENITYPNRIDHDVEIIRTAQAQRIKTVIKV